MATTRTKTAIDTTAQPRGVIGGVYDGYDAGGKSSKSNREKVYSAGGNAFFGKIRDCRDIAQSCAMTAHVFLEKYTAVNSINKSPDAKNNRSKICRKGKTLYVLGSVSEPDNEYLVFSEDSCVFKRMWTQVEPHVRAVGSVVKTVDVIGVGYVKDVKAEYSLPKIKRRSSGGGGGGVNIPEGIVKAYKVQLTSDPLSAVWITVPGLQHMDTLSAPFPSVPSAPPLVLVPVSSSSSLSSAASSSSQPVHPQQPFSLPLPPPIPPVSYQPPGISPACFQISPMLLQFPQQQQQQQQSESESKSGVMYALYYPHHPPQQQSSFNSIVPYPIAPIVSTSACGYPFQFCVTKQM